MLHLFNSIQPISLRLLEFLAPAIDVRSIDHNVYLLRNGQLPNRIWYIKSGLIRCFCRDGDMEITTGFYKGGDLIIPLNFHSQNRSDEYMRSMEHCTLYSLTIDNIQMIYKDFPEFNYHIRILIERQATLAEECLRFFRNGQASDRYKWFAERFPELIQRVPGRHLASYIGVTESTLSRIKRKKI